MTNFHGQHKKRSFFEGWYLKHQAGKSSLAVIPAYHIDRAGRPSASLQVITPTSSCTIPYPAGSFHASPERFSVQIGKNHFTDQGISLDITTKDISVKGNLRYGIFAAPRSDLMGPFRHLPFMQCNHGILSFAHSLEGVLHVNGGVLDFTGGTGYIEKDWGVSFPSSYLWAQCSWTEKISRSSCCIMLSIADIPFLVGHFTGCIASVYYCGDEYRLATYHGAKVLEQTKRSAVVGQGDYLLHVDLIEEHPNTLHAPASGSMSRTIHESLCSRVRFQFYIRRKKVIDFISSKASFETG